MEQPGVARPLTGAVLLTGGGGRRLGGVDKAGLTHHGRSFLDLALAAVLDPDQPDRPDRLDPLDPGDVVVVGEPVAGVRSVREQPAGGGPAAGLLAGLDALRADVEAVVVLAVDMPLVTAATTRRLRAAYARAGGDGALLVDADGRQQYLCGVYRVAALRAAAPPPQQRAGLPVRRLLAPLSLAQVPARGGEAHDVDAWADLAALPPAPG